MTDPDPSFDRYARMVRRALRVPVGLVTLVEVDRQVFAGCAGLPEPLRSRRETPLSHSLCQYVVADERPLVISDARADDRLRDNLGVRDLGVIAYAGWPLTDASGRVVGSLCAIDSQPRQWTSDEADALRDLADACSAELAQREGRAEADRSGAAAREVSAHPRVAHALEALAATNTLADVAEAVQRVAIETFGADRALVWVHQGGARLQYVAHPDDDAAPRPYQVVPLDGSTPLGAVLLGGYARFYGDRAAVASDYPELPATVGEAWAIMPLTAGVASLGVLALMWAAPREFSDDDRITIAALTAYTAQAVQRASLLAERMSATTTLMSAMLTELPRLDGVQLTARYRPAIAQDEVGGDWYDAIVLKSDCTALTIGDVSGHDIRAAADMGQLRSMLRAFAWSGDDAPSQIVTNLDRAMRDLRVRTSATLVFGRLDNATHTFSWANAGHPPPLLVEPDGTARFLTDERGNDLLLGMSPDRPRRDLSVDLPPGSTLMLYTDGLVERADEIIDAGFARLATAASLHRARPLDRMVDAVIDDLVGYTAEDDVAVLGVRIESKEN